MITLVKRGEVYDADLDPVRGSEQAGKRPIIIVQTDRLNKIAGYTVVVVIPVTAEQVDQRRRYFNNVFIPQGEGGLTQDSVALCGQVRALSRDRLIRKRGDLSATTMGKIEFALRLVLGI